MGESFHELGESMSGAAEGMRGFVLVAGGIQAGKTAIIQRILADAMQNRIGIASHIDLPMFNYPGEMTFPRERSLDDYMVDKFNGLDVRLKDFHLNEWPDMVDSGTSEDPPKNFLFNEPPKQKKWRNRPDKRTLARQRKRK